VQGTAITNTTTLTVADRRYSCLLVRVIRYLHTALNPQTQYELPYSVTGGGLRRPWPQWRDHHLLGAIGGLRHGLFTRTFPGLAQTFTANNCTPTQVEEYNGVINPQPPPTGVTPVLTSIPGSVAATDVSSAVTSSSGTASVKPDLPEGPCLLGAGCAHGDRTVQGTQNSATATFWLPGTGSGLCDADVMPPGQISPTARTHLLLTAAKDQLDRHGRRKAAVYCPAPVPLSSAPMLASAISTWSARWARARVPWDASWRGWWTHRSWTAMPKSEKRTGVDISYIFEREGEPRFRQREKEAIEALTGLELGVGHRGAEPFCCPRIATCWRNAAAWST